MIFVLFITKSLKHIVIVQVDRESNHSIRSCWHMAWSSTISTIGVHLLKLFLLYLLMIVLSILLGRYFDTWLACLLRGNKTCDEKRANTESHHAHQLYIGELVLTHSISLQAELGQWDETE